MDRARMHIFDRAWMGISARVDKWESILQEIVLTISSMWASYRLLTPPSNFASFPSSFSFAEVVGTETQWGYLVLLGAFLKLVGLAISCFKNGWIQGLSLSMRLLGLMVSGTFWTLISLSTMYGNPDTLYGFLGLLSGFTAWFLIVKLAMRG